MVVVPSAVGGDTVTSNYDYDTTPLMCTRGSQLKQTLEQTNYSLISGFVANLSHDYCIQINTESH